MNMKIGKTYNDYKNLKITKNQVYFQKNMLIRFDPPNHSGNKYIIS
jgi:hypothetical protein